MYESRRWQNCLSLLLLCQCGWSAMCHPTGSLYIRVELCMQTDRGFIVLCFCYIWGLAKWLQFQKAQHKPGLTNAGGRGNAVFITRRFALSCFFSVGAVTLTVCLSKQVPGEQASSCKLDRVTSHIISHQDWPGHYTWISGWVLNPKRKKEGEKPTVS